MTINDIQELLEKEPFEPFKILVTGGESYEVRNPHSVAVMKRRMLIALPDGDHFVICPYLHVSSIKTINGRTKRKKRR